MAELLFIATTIFVAYVVFVVLGEKKEASSTEKPVAAKPEMVKTVMDKPPVMEKSVDPAPVATVVKSAAKKTTRSKPAAAAKPAAVSDSLKNPETGEITKIPTSYNFAKRWIKEALVEEGLLEKIYKNNELDDTTNARFQAALQQLRAMEKYS